MDRLTVIAQDGVAVNFNYYDAANRLLQNGLSRNGAGASAAYVALLNSSHGTPGSAPGAGLMEETQQNVYDSNGRQVHQITRDERSDHPFNRVRYIDNHYDNVGNVTHTNFEVVKQYNIQYNFAYKRFDSYQLDYATGAANNGSSGSRLLGGWLGSFVSSALHMPGLGEYLGYTERIFNGVGGFEGGSGTTQNAYDVNGQLVATSYSHAPTRRYVNSAQGQMLYANIAGDANSNTGTIQHKVIANGEHLGTYGMSGDKPIADFNFSYQKLTGQQGGVSRYTVQAGDTLRSIARTVYGDETLWFRIADSNGLAGDTDIRPGQVLSITSQLSTAHNNADTFKHFDQRQIAGDSTPTLGAPGEACGGNGQVIVTVVAVVVTAVLAYFTVGTSLTATNAMWAALAAASGNLAGQVVAKELKLQDGINWKSVAVSAAGGAMSVGLGATGAFNFTGGSIVSAAVGNAVTQGIAIGVGLQEKFDWRSVAVAAASAAVGEVLGGKDVKPQNMGFIGRAAYGTLVGVARAVTSTVVRGGQVSMTQVATDAFGVALGESLASGSSAPALTEEQVGAGQQWGTQLGGTGSEGVGFGGNRTYSFMGDDSGQSMHGSGYTEAEMLDGSRRSSPLPDAGQQYQAFADRENAERVAFDARMNAGRADAAAVRAYANKFVAGIDSARAAAQAATYFNANYSNEGRNHLAVVSSGPTMVSQNVYTAAGDYAGSVMVPAVGSASPTTYAQGVGNAVTTAGQLAWGATKLVAAGAYNEVVKIGGGLASIPYAVFAGTDAAAAVQEAAHNALSWTPGGEGVQMIGRGLAPVGQIVGELSNSLRATSEHYLGDGATTFIAAGLQASGEIAGTISGLKGAQVLVEGGLGTLDAGLANLGTPRAMGPMAAQRGTASIELLSGGLVREAVPQIASPRVALQGAVDQAVAALNANPRLASDVMSLGSYQHLVNRTGLADASYGKAVERLTARIVREDPGLSASLQYQSRPFVATPDFFGYEGHNLHLLDITTERSIPAHLLRSYGPATQYVTHPGLPPGLVFK